MDEVLAAFSVGILTASFIMIAWVIAIRVSEKAGR
jgi:hypothetical protein